MTPMRLSGWVEDTAAGFAPQLMQSVSLRTSISDDAVVLTGDNVVKILRKQPLPETPPGVGSKLLYALKPTFVMESPLLGQQVVAPFGVAKKGEAAKNVTKIKWALGLITIGLVATGFVLGRGIK